MTEVRFPDPTNAGPSPYISQCVAPCKLRVFFPSAYDLKLVKGNAEILPLVENDWWKCEADERFVDLDVKSAGPIVVGLVDERKGQDDASMVMMINASPRIVVKGVELMPEALCVKTVMTRCLGALRGWAAVMEQIVASGYNAVHFTPVQTLGDSGSAYCVADHDELAPWINGTWAQLEESLVHLRQVTGVASFTDVVWNHVASNCKWVKKHPECGYSVSLSLLKAASANSPHLRPALELDLALQRLGARISAGAFPGLPSGSVTSEAHIDAILLHVSGPLWTALRLWEYFVIDEKSIDSLVAGPTTTTTTTGDFDKLLDLMKSQALVHSGVGQRFGWTFKHEVARRLCPDMDEFRRCILTINLHRHREVDALKETILLNLRHRLRYNFIEAPDPSHPRPLFEPYFVKMDDADDMDDHDALFCACNGWTVGGGGSDHADSSSHAYLRRDVIVWSDLIKLRYGRGPEDCPFLWSTMERYTRQTAQLFDGIRIDNAHTTPAHVAAHMLELARRIKPSLYVVAELFTDSDVATADYFFQVSGLHSMVVEAMRAPNAKGLSHLVHRFGGGERPVGYVYPQQLIPSVPRSMFMDCSHDNKTPAQERSIVDTLSNGASVWAAHCAVGSTWGLDELVPYNISVERERRIYVSATTTTTTMMMGNDALLPGICSAKARLGALHERLALGGYSEVHVHQEGDLLFITRHHPSTFDAYYFVIHTAFVEGAPATTQHTVHIPQGVDINFELALQLEMPPTWRDQISWREHVIEGLSCGRLNVFSPQDGPRFIHTTATTALSLHNFPPGSVMVLHSQLCLPAQVSIKDLEALLADGSAARALASCTLLDMNSIMFRCEQEEQATTRTGCYVFPGAGAPNYCGIGGLYHFLRLHVKGDMASPVFENIRQGDWLLTYCVERLQRHDFVAPSVGSFAEWLQRAALCCAGLPRHLKPRFVVAIITAAWHACVERCVALMPGLAALPPRSSFARALSLVSVQMHGHLPSADIRVSVGGVTWRYSRATMAAGLPWFGTGFMRCWGRDTFIAMRGLYLVPGRFAEARDLIRVFAACVREGVVPNLLDGANRPRYNARDASWWFLQALQDLYLFDPHETIELLRKRITRVFPSNAGPKSAFALLSDIVQEILQAHASGINFRDDGADDDMKQEGFDINISLDLSTGLIYGGNAHNCGTWMDKMGSSQRAGNKGVPATPRDGCAVEIIGLLKSALKWLDKLHAEGLYHHAGVSLQARGRNFLTWKDWSTLIQDNFERHFWVPLDQKEDTNHVIDSSVVHRRGIYKDSHGSSSHYTDYQLRPNFCVAMVVAPELFEREHARHALDMVQQWLVGPLGVKTLDPRDLKYRGVYANRVDSDDYLTSKGFNYHQGPEWLWPLGFYLRARLAVLDTRDAQFAPTIALANHRALLHHSLWAGLPELTNADGVECADSCPTQAWSVATLMDYLFDWDSKQ